MKTFQISPLEFDEQRDLIKHKAWFYDITHSYPAWDPMTACFWIKYCSLGTQWAAEKLSIPTCKGWDWTVKNGAAYLAFMIVEDEEELKQREERFRQSIIPLIQDYDGVWNGCINEMLDRYAVLKKCDVDNCSNIELAENFEETVLTYKRMWELHFYMMYAVDGVYALFESICKEWLGIDDSSPDFLRLMSGFDNKCFKTDRLLWQLSKRALELGLDKIILESNPDEYVTNINAHPNGSKFMAELQEFLEIDGWRGDLCNFKSPTWLENPKTPLIAIKQFLVSGGDFSLDRGRERLVVEREELEKKILSELPEERREYFEVLMHLAQKSSNFSEEHNYYFDLYVTAMVRRSLMAIGRRFTRAGGLENAEDIVFLVPDEVRKVYYNPEYHDMRHVVSERRKMWEEWCAVEKPPILGNVTMDEAMVVMMKAKDPMAMKVNIGTFPIPKLELKADLYGVSGSPGVAEGVARVILSENDLNNIQSGDILVAPYTSPAWTPVFAMLKGVVVDRGASLSHAAIVGREYGIPVVMNVFVGSTKIKNGMRIRVDGDMGVVYFLEEAAENVV